MAIEIHWSHHQTSWASFEKSQYTYLDRWIRCSSSAARWEKNMLNASHHPSLILNSDPWCTADLQSILSKYIQRNLAKIQMYIFVCEGEVEYVKHCMTVLGCSEWRNQGGGGLMPHWFFIALLTGTRGTYQGRIRLFSQFHSRDCRRACWPNRRSQLHLGLGVLRACRWFTEGTAWRENSVKFSFLWNSDHFYLKTNVNEMMLQRCSPYK